MLLDQHTPTIYVAEPIFWKLSLRAKICIEMNDFTTQNTKGPGIYEDVILHI